MYFIVLSYFLNMIYAKIHLSHMFYEVILPVMLKLLFINNYLYLAFLNKLLLYHKDILISNLLQKMFINV